MTASLIGVLFLLVLLAFANPFMLFMPSGIEYMALALLAVVSSIFVGLMFREHARDEREEALRARAARMGYLAGVTALTLGIIVSVLSGHQADPWILGALAAMIIVRLTSRVMTE